MKEKQLFKGCDIKNLDSYLKQNSNLPGPRANLSLASCLTDFLLHVEDNLIDYYLNIVISWCNIPAQKAPTNTPEEYLPFCGFQSLGALFFRVQKPMQDQILSLLKKGMNDERWRIKESVAIAFQFIGEKDFTILKENFSRWLPNSNFSEKRAIIASLAHPPLLKDSYNANYSLTVSDTIMSSVLRATNIEKKTEGFKVLVKGLSYALSLFVSSSPNDGFLLLDKFANTKDQIILKIILSNLNKSRIKNKFPQNVEQFKQKFYERF